MAVRERVRTEPSSPRVLPEAPTYRRRRCRRPSDVVRGGGAIALAGVVLATAVVALLVDRAITGGPSSSAVDDRLEVVVAPPPGYTGPNWLIRLDLKADNKRWKGSAFSTSDASCLASLDGVTTPPSRYKFGGWERPKRAAEPAGSRTVQFPPGVDVIAAFTATAAGCEMALNYDGSTAAGESWKFYEPAG